MLAMLAGADGAIVSRQAFVAVAWNRNDLVVDRVVSDTVSSLRRNLQDDDPNHPLIRTIPRRGYQLAAPVQPAVAQPPTLVPGGEVLHSSGWPRSHDPAAHVPDGGSGRVALRADGCRLRLFTMGCGCRRPGPAAIAQRTEFPVGRTPFYM